MASNDRTRGTGNDREGKSCKGYVPLGPIFFAVLLGYSPPSLSAEIRGHVVHVVLVWLNDPGNAADQARVVATTRALAQATGAEEVRVGAVLPSKRPVADDSFDIGLLYGVPLQRGPRCVSDTPGAREGRRVGPAAAVAKDQRL